MNEVNTQYKEFRNTLLLCSLLCFLFYFFIQQNPSSAKKDPKSVKQVESVLTDQSAVVSENNIVKVNKPLPFHPANPEGNRTIAKFICNNEPSVFSDKAFGQIKILLRCSIYNQYFASGLHGLPLSV